MGTGQALYQLSYSFSPQAPTQADWVSVCVALRLSHSCPRPSRRLLVPWMLSALPLAMLSPPSWDPMPSRYHCPSVRRSATAWTPPTHGAMTGGCWHRSSPWTGEYPKLWSPPLLSSSGSGTAVSILADKGQLPAASLVPVTRDRSTAGFGCTESGMTVPLHVLHSVPLRELAFEPGGL